MSLTHIETLLAREARAARSLDKLQADIGQALRRWRGRVGVSLDAVAAHAKVSQADLSLLERGRGRFAPQRVRAAAQAIDALAAERAAERAAAPVEAPTV